MLVKLISGHFCKANLAADLTHCAETVVSGFSCALCHDLLEVLLICGETLEFCLNVSQTVCASLTYSKLEFAVALPSNSLSISSKVLPVNAP